jgi:protein-S-isoprenylcysteine O-methyltransferase Ste14
MNRVTIFFYGTLSYLTCLAAFLYTAGFICNFGVPKSMDSPAEGPWQNALSIDPGLLLVFALQHSAMARPAFKNLRTRVIPPAAERSAYLMASNLALILLFRKWRPLGGTVRAVQNGVEASLLYTGYAFGWALLLLATFAINHFDLFGLRQIRLNLQGRPQSALVFSTPWLLFAVMTTIYILVASRIEERDLIAKHPEYADYRRQVPRIVPDFHRV